MSEKIATREAYGKALVELGASNDKIVVLLYKATCFDGELRSSPEGRVWWEDIADLPKLKLSLDMRDMLRVFTEEALSEFFYYQEGSAWKYDLK